MISYWEREQCCIVKVKRVSKKKKKRLIKCVLSVEQWMRGEFFKWEYPWARAPKKSSSYGINIGTSAVRCIICCFVFFVSFIDVLKCVVSLKCFCKSQTWWTSVPRKAELMCLILLLFVTWEGIITWSFLKWLSTHSDCMWVPKGCLYVTHICIWNFHLQWKSQEGKRIYGSNLKNSKCVSFPSTSWFWLSQ